MSLSIASRSKLLRHDQDSMQPCTQTRRVSRPLSKFAYAYKVSSKFVIRGNDRQQISESPMFCAIRHLAWSLQDYYHGRNFEHPAWLSVCVCDPNT